MDLSTIEALASVSEYKSFLLKVCKYYAPNVGLLPVEMRGLYPTPVFISLDVKIVCVRMDCIASGLIQVHQPYFRYVIATFGVVVDEEL
jgi:hypothetical protein